MTLPVYDSWAFTTTERGDLETLARRLTARDLSAASRPLALDAGSVTGDVDGRVAPLLGALHPVDATEAWAPMAADAAATTLTGELERSGGAPVVGLPVYGSTASGSTDVAAGWSRQLNLDPRRRAAAGLGAAMVRDHQEALVDEAWRQAGDIDRAKREHQGARLADLAASRLRTRMIEPLTAASALVTMAPALARTTAAPGTTQRALVADSAVPPAMLDAPLRRIAATKLPRAARSAGQGIRTAIAVQNAQVLFPGGPPPAPVSTVTLGAVQAELGTTPVNTGIVPPGVVTPPIGPGPIVHGGGHVLHGGPALHADLATGTGAHADVATGSAVTAAALSPALTAAIATAAASIDLTITATQSTMVSQLLPSIEADVSQVFTVTAPHALSWTPPPPTPTPATATSRARARLVVTGGIVFDLPVGMRTTPRFAQPLAAWLEPGLLLAGVDLPPDTAGLLEVNAGFVEALLVGANHELARELLWRGVPLDRRATLLTQFFEAEGTTPPAGLQPVAEWTADRRSRRSRVVRRAGRADPAQPPRVAPRPDDDLPRSGRRRRRVPQARHRPADAVVPRHRRPRHGLLRLPDRRGVAARRARLVPRHPGAGRGGALRPRRGGDHTDADVERPRLDVGRRAARLRRRDAGPSASAHHRRIGVGCRRRTHGRDLHAAPGARLDPHVAAPAGRWLMAPPYTELDAALPIVMLPVRVETRWFAVNADLIELRVRIFPSRLHTYVDRPGIDPIERDETIAYWRIRRADGDDALTTEAAWNRLVQLFGEVRAQYLRRLLTPDAALSFPDVPIADPNDDAVLSAVATGLPTRFFIAAYAGDLQAFRSEGTAIPDEVAVGPAGDAAAIAWQTDFAAAEAIGLGIRQQMTRPIAATLTRLVVFGVREGAAAATSDAALQRLLTVHAQRDGVALLEPGTPTNNTPASRTPAVPVAAGDPPAAASERARVAAALGVDASAVAGGDDVTEPAITAMHAAMWQVTFQYFFDTMQTATPDAQLVARAKQLYAASVRPDGPLRTLVVGNQPYGLLPVSPLSRLRGRHRSRSPTRCARCCRRGVPRRRPPSPGSAPAATSARSSTRSCRRRRTRCAGSPATPARSSSAWRSPA